MIGYYYFSYTQIPCFALQVHCFPIARSLPRLLRQSKSDSKQCAHNLGYQYQNYKYCYILTLFCCYKGIIVSNSGDYEIYNPLALIYNQWPLVAPVSMVAPTLTTGEFTKSGLEEAILHSRVRQNFMGLSYLYIKSSITTVDYTLFCEAQPACIACYCQGVWGHAPQENFENSLL